MFRRILPCFLVASFLLGPVSALESLTVHLTERLRNRIEAAGFPPQIAIGDDMIMATAALPQFYEKRFYRPAWVADTGISPQAESFVVAIDRAEEEGFHPGDYHLARIEAILRELKDAGGIKLRMESGKLVELDLLLTDAFLILGSHYIAGMVDPLSIDAEWHTNLREADLIGILDRGLSENRIVQELAALLPPQPGYARLRQGLARYRSIKAKGGWPTVPDGPKLQNGDRDARVEALRRRLSTTGDATGPNISSSDLFDDSLEAAVRRFQTRHGLDIDGVVGPATLAALNVGVDKRIQQILLNMERWRWLPQDLGQRHILINIASFELDLVEADSSVLDMKVIVGKAYRRTPVFSDRMTYLVFNPYWNIPDNIALQDILPQVRKDPEYLTRLDIKVMRGWGSEMQIVDPAPVDWTKIGNQNMPYRFRQEPGSKNFLGHVKFMFPNKFNVYLHDTPDKNLFAKSSRIFSSGCIRLEKAKDLAFQVLRGDPKWMMPKIDTAMGRNVEQTVRLPEAIPVHLLYWTAWAAPDGTIHFREDVYLRDEILWAALSENPPTAPK